MRRDGEDGAQAGFGILERQRATMQLRHRLHQGQAKSGARRVPGQLAAKEPLRGAAAITNGNARPAILNDEGDGVG